MADTANVYADIVRVAVPTTIAAITAYLLGGKRRENREDRKQESETTVGLVNASSAAFDKSAERYDKMSEKLEKMQDRLIPLELRVQDLEGKVGRLENDIVVKDGLIKLLTIKCRALTRMVVIRDKEGLQKDSLIGSLLSLFSEQSDSMTHMVKKDKETDISLMKMKLADVEKTVRDFANTYKASSTTTIEDLIENIDKPTIEEQFLEDTLEEAIELRLRQQEALNSANKVQEVEVILPANIHLTSKE